MASGSCRRRLRSVSNSTCLDRLPLTGQAITAGQFFCFTSQHSLMMASKCRLESSFADRFDQLRRRSLGRIVLNRRAARLEVHGSRSYAGRFEQGIAHADGTALASHPADFQLNCEKLGGRGSSGRALPGFIQSRAQRRVVVGKGDQCQDNNRSNPQERSSPARCPRCLAHLAIARGCLLWLSVGKVEAQPEEDGGQSEEV